MHRSRDPSATSFEPQYVFDVDGFEGKYAVPVTRELQKVKLRCEFTGITDLCFSPDGKMIVTGNIDGYARIFDSANGEVIMKSTQHACAVTTVSFSRDGKMIATGDANGFVRIPRRNLAGNR